MAQTKPKARLSGVSYAVSNTGPLISAFQSDSFSLLTKIFAEIQQVYAMAKQNGGYS